MITKMQNDKVIIDNTEFIKITDSYIKEQLDLKKRSNSGQELTKIRMLSKILQVAYTLVFEDTKSKFHGQDLTFDKFNKDYNLNLKSYLDSITEKPKPNLFKKLFKI